MKNYISALMLAVLLSACEKEPRHMLIKGGSEYYFASLLANKPIDLDGDGIASNDLKSEFRYFKRNPRETVLEVFWANPETGNVGMYLKCIPKMNWYYSDPDGLDVIPAAIFYTASYNFKNHAISNLYADKFEYDDPLALNSNIAPLVVEEMVLVDEETITFRFRHLALFDRTTKQWMGLELEGVLKWKGSWK
jgi:hypothetical protein